MKSPLERAARALHRYEEPTVGYDDLTAPRQRMYIGLARAVLTAIREPSVVMIDHGQGAILERWVRAEGPDVDSAKASWQSMIDAALKEG